MVLFIGRSTQVLVLFAEQVGYSFLYYFILLIAAKCKVISRVFAEFRSLISIFYLKLNAPQTAMPSCWLRKWPRFLEFFIAERSILSCQSVPSSHRSRDIYTVNIWARKLYPRLNFWVFGDFTHQVRRVDRWDPQKAHASLVWRRSTAWYLIIVWILRVRSLPHARVSEKRKQKKKFTFVEKPIHRPTWRHDHLFDLQRICEITLLRQEIT